MNIIAIDCGASFIKGALINSIKEDKILNRTYRKTSALPEYSNISLGTKNIDEIVMNVQSILDELCTEGETYKLCISNEMHGFILTDEDGHPLIDYVSWQYEMANEIESGGISYLENLKSKINRDDAISTGMGIKAGLPSTNLYVLIKKGKITCNRDIHFYTLGDYIIRFLANKIPKIHPTNAAATGLYNLNTGEWNSNIINLVCQSNVKFPQISHSTEFLFFEYNNCYFEVLPAIGDQQAALLGANLFSLQTVSFNIGTGGQVSVLNRNLTFSNKYQTRPYFSNFYINTVAHIPSGRALNVFFKFVKNIVLKFNKNMSDNDIWDFILDEAIKYDKENLSVDLSFFTNAISGTTKGGINDILENNFYIGNLFQSVYKQMCKNYIIALGRITDNLNSYNSIVFTGGVAQKTSLLREYIYNQFASVDYVDVVVDETFLGLFKYCILNLEKPNNSK